MKKTLLLLCTITSFCLAAAAQEVSFVKNKTWKQILELARQQNKPIFFDAFASWCGPCQYMDESVYTSKDVAAYYNANYINVKMDMEEGEGVKLSEEFGIASYPTFLFITPSGQLIHRAVGAMKPKDFINLGKDARNPAKQYYPLKEKAKKNSLSDSAFAAWAASARKMYDEDLAAYASAFLAGKKDILGNEFIATVALKYADDLSDAQLHYLVRNEARLGQVMKLDKKQAAEAIYNRLFKKALAEYEQGKDRKKFLAVFSKFDAKRENLAMKDLDLRIALFVDEDTRSAATLLVGYLTAPDRLTLEQTAELLIGNISDFGEGDYQFIAEKLSQYRLTPADAGQEAWLYLMLMASYYSYGESGKAKEYGEKAYRQGGLSEDYNKMLREQFGLE